MSTCELIYQVLFFFLLCLFIAVISSSGKEALTSTLVNLAASLPQFQRPFTTTTVIRCPELVSASDEETLDKDRSHIMDGIHHLNEVSTCSKV